MLFSSFLGVTFVLFPSYYSSSFLLFFVVVVVVVVVIVVVFDIAAVASKT